MYAIFDHGGKQYKVKKDDVIKLEKFDCTQNDIIKFTEILVLGDGKGDCTIGSPFVKNASVALKVLDVIKDKKVLIFKKKRRHNYRRKAGHRQNLIVLKVTEISQKLSTISKSSKDNTKEDLLKKKEVQPKE